MENIKFSDMNISNNIKKALAEKGYEEATAIQSIAIEPILNGLDVLGLAQTGTGKTCAFAVPIVEKVDTENTAIQTLILCPTRELVLQTCEEIVSLLKYKEKIRVAPIYGGQSIDKQIFLLKKKPQIIVGTPGRILDHIRRKTVRLEHINSLVLDEADEMLNMGFKEDLDLILSTANQVRQTILFSATMSDEIRRIAASFQKNPVLLEIKHETITVDKIKQYYIEINESKKIELLDRLVSSLDTKLGLVFCNTKKKVDELTLALQMRGFSVEALHGDMRQSARDGVLNKFKHGHLQLLIATDVAARGIDVNNIEIVFNYDIPIDDEYYVHRIGRTGRAGKEGTAITFITAREYGKLKYIEKYTKAKIEKYVIPSVDNLIENKVNRLLVNVKPDYNSEYAAYVDSYLEGNSDLTISDIAYYLIEEKLGKVKNEVFETNDYSTDSTRMFINLGKMDQMNMKNLLDFLTTNSDLNNDDIQRVEIFDKFSFFNIPANMTEMALRSISGTFHNQRRVGLEISGGKTRKQNNFRSNDNYRSNNNRSNRNRNDRKKEYARNNDKLNFIPKEKKNSRFRPKKH